MGAYVELGRVGTVVVLSPAVKNSGKARRFYDNVIKVGDKLGREIFLCRRD